MSNRAKDHKAFTIKTLRALAQNIEEQRFDYDPRDFKIILDEAEMYYTNYLGIKNSNHKRYNPKYKDLTF
jgi:hypothetical protein